MGYSLLLLQPSYIHYNSIIQNSHQAERDCLESSVVKLKPNVVTLKWCQLVSSSCCTFNAISPKNCLCKIGNTHKMSQNSLLCLPLHMIAIHLPGESNSPYSTMLSPNASSLTHSQLTSQLPSINLNCSRGPFLFSKLPFIWFDSHCAPDEKKHSNSWGFYCSLGSSTPTKVIHKLG